MSLLEEGGLQFRFLMKQHLLLESAPPLAVDTASAARTRRAPNASLDNSWRPCAVAAPPKGNHFAG